MKFGPNLLSFSITRKHLSLKGLSNRLLYTKVLQNIKTLFIIKYGFKFLKIKTTRTPTQDEYPSHRLSDYTTPIHYTTPIDQADSITSKVDIVYQSHHRM